MQKAIKDIRRSLSTIVTALTRLAKAAEAKGRHEKPTAAPRRKVKLSADRMEALKQQGAYMGALRSLGPRQKVQVKAVRAAKGLDAAMRLAKRMAR